MVFYLPPCQFRPWYLATTLGLFKLLTFVLEGSSAALQALMLGDIVSVIAGQCVYRSMIKVGIAGVPLALKAKVRQRASSTYLVLDLTRFEVQVCQRVSMKEETAVEVGNIARKLRSISPSRSVHDKPCLQKIRRSSKDSKNRIRAVR